MRQDRLRGFTLVEVLVVTAVMAVLISILLPSLGRAREDARRTVCLANLKHVGASLFSYASTNRELGPQIMAPIDKRSPRTLLSLVAETVNLGLMMPKHVAEPNVLICPSQKVFNYARDMRLLRHERVAGSYAYAISITARQSPRLATVRHLALASDDFTAGPDGSGLGRYAHRVGYNVLHTDGSVNWFPDPSGSVWKRNIEWDDETDDITYASYYKTYAPGSTSGSYYYSRKYDIFRVWSAFCYRRPSPFN
jgi:prepilin-type N-terminal cleavage/methylation domain-containing protein